jgi:hypothetical protein
LKFRYGSFAEFFLYGEGMERLKKSSIWWRDLWSLGREVDATHGRQQWSFNNLI